MKINVVIPSSVLGGGIRVVFLYSNYLTSQGHDVCVYIPCLFAWEDLNGGKINIKTSLANTFKRGTRLKWFDNKFKIKLAWRIEDKYIRDADITIATAWFTSRNVYNLSEKKGKKVYFVQDYEIWHQIKEVVDNTYKLDMHRICITNTLRETLQKECGVDSNVVYNGIPEEEFLVGEKGKNAQKTIIMLGNFADYKGGMKGVELLARLHETHDVRIIIFGVGSRPQIPEYIEYYQQPKRVFLLRLYRESDILLFPSLQEAWGLSVVEAWANKVAVVGMRTGCLEELGIDGKNAIIANHDFEELYQKLERLVDDEAALEVLQTEGYETAKKLSWDISYRKFEKILKKLLIEEE